MITIKTINSDLKNSISRLDDQPAMTAAEIKAELDKASNGIIDYLNEGMVDDLNSNFNEISNGIESATTSINNINISLGEVNTTLQGKQDVISLGGGKVVMTNAEGKLIASDFNSEDFRAIYYGTDEPNNSDGLSEGSIYLKVVE